jgi:hypothetical protein
MRHPLLYQLNTRVLLAELGRGLGRPATLRDLSDAVLDDIARRGFQWVWLLGVWQTGEVSRRISRTDPTLRASYDRLLPGWRDEDVCGSPFAVRGYQVNGDFGGDEALAGLRDRLRQRGLSLLLDFVPNHVAPDHPWVEQHPEYLIEGDEGDLAREPRNWGRFATARGSKVLAYGRDPYFPGWSDTVQLNYMSAGLREAMREVLARIADRCDGVRCDMAMLVQPQVFRRTWGDRARPRDGSPAVEQPFWNEAIAGVKRRHPGFMFMAEVYWDMEWELQQAGFDYTYDKRLYDRLVAGQARPVYEHLLATPEFQDRSARFLENHDEPRAAHEFQPGPHMAAAVITYTVPGLRFFHEGQLEGRQAFVSMHLARRPLELPDPPLVEFYERLLACLRRPELREGRWRLLAPRAAWPDNPTWQQFYVATWEAGDDRSLVVVNFGPNQGQCYVDLPLPGLTGRPVTMVDLLGDARYEREGSGLVNQGLYLDVPPWGRQLFDLHAA